MTRKIGIIGSRRRDSPIDRKLLTEKFFEIYEEGDIICSGGCPQGGDRFAQIIAKKYGIPILIYYPNWTKYKKAAGIIRNTDIAHNSDIILACVANDRTGGTEDTIKKYQKKCKKNNIKEEIYLV